MRRKRWAGIGVVVGAGAVVMIGWSLLARDRGQAGGRSFGLGPRVATAATMPALVANPPPDDPAPVAVSVADALYKPIDLPFGDPTSLADVQKYLARVLGAPVVLDLAALDRVDAGPDDTVRLDLKGVRLKTGLKLLLDQVRLTYRVVPEDNLLILTDASEAGEPIDQALRELKTLHDELHDLADAVDELRGLVEEDLGVEPEVDPNAAVFVRSTSRPTPAASADRSRVRRHPARPRPSPSRLVPTEPRGEVRG